MSSETAISIRNLSKCYQIYDKPRDRLLQMFFRGRRQYFREFWALRDVSFDLAKGETFGIVGRNGAGKSTLLQLICGTLNPSSGEVTVQGRVAALLELGAGFNPEFTGRENVYLSATVLGLTQDEINARYAEIVDFSGIGDFIGQPVKTYSSGMYVRLAFAVATSVEPDILVVDEALSVGDGEFARKSLERIMELKKRGTTILFCSHSMYQVEAFCERALWLDKGDVRMLDSVFLVTAAYQAAQDAAAALDSSAEQQVQIDTSGMKGRLVRVSGEVDGFSGASLKAHSLQSTLAVTFEFVVDPKLPPPTLALAVHNAAGLLVASASSANDGLSTRIDSSGNGRATIVFPKLPLLKGEYSIDAYLACERALLLYDTAERCITLQVVQKGQARGMVELPHVWRL